MSAQETAEAMDQRSVASTSSSVMGMVLFVASETMFFMAFFAVFAASYSATKVWPPLKTPVPPIGVPTAGAVVLVLSAIPMALALLAARRRRGEGAFKWLVATIVLGVAFCVLWVVGLPDVGFGIKGGIYASLFYVMNGLGIAHVIGGIVFAVMVSTQAAAGELRLRRDPAEALAVYWFFVVVLGVALFAAFYLAAS
ncbi:MAG TPA: cytochrome c oxidase subunit 3 [Actinomycetota bacterium]|nr:cytochrome c oxidase subunit 3 [Actinomycetota bacterium]